MSADVKTVRFDVKAPAVQLALDLPTIDAALRMAEIGIKAGVDILEAGTPLIVAEGVRAISALVEAFPDYPVLADYKTMDSGGKNNELTHRCGGKYMTVCANAPDETVRAAVTASRTTGVAVVVDTIGVKDQAARAKQCADWGVHSIFLHYGADQRRTDSSQDSTQWIEQVKTVVDIPIGIATFDAEDAIRGLNAGADLVAIGHPLLLVDDPLGALKDFVDRVRAGFNR